MNEEAFLPNDRMVELRRRWSDIQNEFVDDPRTSVRHAHGMVAEVVNEPGQDVRGEETYATSAGG